MSKSPSRALTGRHFLILRQRGYHYAAFVVFVFLATIFTTATASAQEVVVNPSLRETQISKSSLRAIFGMRLRQWPDGSAVTVFVLPSDHPLHISFSKNILHVFPHQLERSWNRLVFSGTGQRPVEVESQEEMRARVAKTPGAIGYLEKGTLDDSVRKLDVRL